MIITTPFCRWLCFIIPSNSRLAGSATRASFDSIFGIFLLCLSLLHSLSLSLSPSLSHFFSLVSFALFIYLSIYLYLSISPRQRIGRLVHDTRLRSVVYAVVPTRDTPCPLGAVYRCVRACVDVRVSPHPIRH